MPNIQFLLLEKTKDLRVIINDDEKKSRFAERIEFVCDKRNQQVILTIFMYTRNSWEWLFLHLLYNTLNNRSKALADMNLPIQKVKLPSSRIKNSHSIIFNDFIHSHEKSKKRLNHYHLIVPTGQDDPVKIMLLFMKFISVFQNEMMDNKDLFQRVYLAMITTNLREVLRTFGDESDGIPEVNLLINPLSTNSNNQFLFTVNECINSTLADKDRPFLKYATLAANDLSKRKITHCDDTILEHEYRNFLASEITQVAGLITHKKYQRAITLCENYLDQYPNDPTVTQQLAVSKQSLLTKNKWCLFFTLATTAVVAATATVGSVLIPTLMGGE
ncbi:MAG: hypothetical protein ABI597_13460 [Gammaproteobacteria bacterium]